MKQLLLFVFFAVVLVFLLASASSLVGTYSTARTQAPAVLHDSTAVRDVPADLMRPPDVLVTRAGSRLGSDGLLAASIAGFVFFCLFLLWRQLR